MAVQDWEAVAYSCAKQVFFYHLSTPAWLLRDRIHEILVWGDWLSTTVLQVKREVSDKDSECRKELFVFVRFDFIRVSVIGSVWQSDAFRHLRHQTQLVYHLRVDHATAVVNQMTADQHGKHEDPHVVICFFFSVAQPLSVDEDHVNFLAALGLDWHGLIPNPEALSAGGCFVADPKSIRSTNQVVKNVRFSSSVHSRNCNYCDRSFNTVEELLCFLIYNEL